MNAWNDIFTASASWHPLKCYKTKDGLPTHCKRGQTVLDMDAIAEEDDDEISAHADAADEGKSYVPKVRCLLTSTVAHIVLRTIDSDGGATWHVHSLSCTRFS